jgi:hypothetical protein
MKGEKHRQQRRLILPPLLKKAVDGYSPALAAVTHAYIERWPGGRAVDLFALILQRWRVAVVPAARIDRVVRFTIAPRHGLPVILHPQDRRFEAAQVAGDIHDLVDLAGVQSAAPSFHRAA